jgi:hypothetical protein
LLGFRLRADGFTDYVPACRACTIIIVFHWNSQVSLYPIRSFGFNKSDKKRQNATGSNKESGFRAGQRQCSALNPCAYRKPGTKRRRAASARMSMPSSTSRGSRAISVIAFLAALGIPG